MLHRLEEFKNLLSVALADGRVTQREIEFLSERANRWGLTDHEFAGAMDYAVRHRGEVAIPRRRAERVELLREMLRMMAADGDLPEVEKRLFATVAAVMKVNGDELNALIDSVVRRPGHSEATEQRDERPRRNAARKSTRRPTSAAPKAKRSTQRDRRP